MAAHRVSKFFGRGETRVKYGDGETRVGLGDGCRYMGDEVETDQFRIEWEERLMEHDGGSPGTTLSLEQHKVRCDCDRPLTRGHGHLLIYKATPCLQTELPMNNLVTRDLPHQQMNPPSPST